MAKCMCKSVGWVRWVNQTSHKGRVHWTSHTWHEGKHPGCPRMKAGCTGVEQSTLGCMTRWQAGAQRFSHFNIWFNGWLLNMRWRHVLRSRVVHGSADACIQWAHPHDGDASNVTCSSYQGTQKKWCLHDETCQLNLEWTLAQGIMFGLGTYK